MVLDYLTSWYGSNPQWSNLLYELNKTYLEKNAGELDWTAVFEVVDNPDLVEGKVVQIRKLGCFSGMGETFDGITLDGDIY